MKVTTDGCLFGAWVAERVRSLECGVGSQNPKAEDFTTLIDIGTGTGLLAMMIAQKNPELRIDAIEVDEGAFEQANDNILASSRENRINIIPGDVRNMQFVDKYDFIVSNPPFYQNELKGDNSKKNIAHHDEGLLLPDLLRIINKQLKPEGIFFLLLPYKRINEIRELFIDHNLDIKSIVLIRQSVKHDYFRIMIEGGLKTKEMAETEINEIAIKVENEKYSDSFTELLKDYYLHL
jgi:tRNA1Val (adenine37-N6)-methyltransferase